MANEAVTEFVRRLLRATREGTLNWELQGSSEFTAKAGKGSVVVGGDATATAFDVRNAAGQVIERLQADPERPGAWRPWEEDLHALWEEARLSAMGTTEVIKDLAEEWKLPPDPNSEFQPSSEDDIPF
jgi:hypothetical protein